MAKKRPDIGSLGAPRGRFLSSCKHAQLDETDIVDLEDVIFGPRCGEELELICLCVDLFDRHGRVENGFKLSDGVAASLLEGGLLDQSRFEFLLK